MVPGTPAAGDRTVAAAVSRGRAANAAIDRSTEVWKEGDMVAMLDFSLVDEAPLP